MPAGHPALWQGAWPGLPWHQPVGDPVPCRCPKGQVPAGAPPGPLGHAPGTPASQCGPRGSHRAAGERSPPPAGQQRAGPPRRASGTGPRPLGGLPGRCAPLRGSVPGRQSVCLPSCPKRTPVSEVGALGLGEGSQGQAGLPGPSHCHSDTGGRSSHLPPALSLTRSPLTGLILTPNPTQAGRQQALPFAQSLCPSAGGGSTFVTTGNLWGTAPAQGVTVPAGDHSSTTTTGHGPPTCAQHLAAVRRGDLSLLPGVSVLATPWPLIWAAPPPGATLRRPELPSPRWPQA